MTSPHRRRRVLAAAGLALVAAVALGFRLWRWDTVPPGLYVDETLTARNALAWRLAEERDRLGATPLLVEGWVETPNLYLAYASAVMAAGGDGLLGIRMVSLLPSLLCVPLLYLLAREVGGPRAGWLAALLLAGSHWAARSGRTGWDQVLMTALQLAALALLARAANRERAREGVAAGALLGLAQHTYVASRLVLLHALLWQAWEALVEWRGLPPERESPPRGEAPPVARATGRAVAGGAKRSAARRLALLAIAALLVAAPFHLRLLRERPEQLLLRAQELSAFSPPAGGAHGEVPWVTLLASARDHLLMFHLRGGAYARDALPGFPMLDPVTGGLLLVGLAVALRRPGWRRRLLLTWPAVALLAGVLSVSGEGAPYPYRVGNLAPWACLVAGLGGAWLWDRLREHQPRSAPALATGALALALAVNAWVLFVAGPAYPGARLVFGVAPTAVGRWLAEHRAGRPALVLVAALKGPKAPARYPFAHANRTDFYRQQDAAVALQLAAGLYRVRPQRALAPLAAGGDVDVLAGVPASLPPRALLVVPLAQAPGLAERFGAHRTAVLRLPDGEPFAVVLAAGAPGS